MRPNWASIEMSLFEFRKCLRPSEVDRLSGHARRVGLPQYPHCGWRAGGQWISARGRAGGSESSTLSEGASAKFFLKPRANHGAVRGCLSLCGSRISS